MSLLSSYKTDFVVFACVYSIGNEVFGFGVRFMREFCGRENFLDFAFQFYADVVSFNLHVCRLVLVEVAS